VGWNGRKIRRKEREGGTGEKEQDEVIEMRKIRYWIEPGLECKDG